MSELVTPEYRATLRAMHATRVWGKNGHWAINDVMPLYEALGCKSMLDYGSGVESLREALAPAIAVACYDPGVIGREAPPEPADFVVCTDTLEHVEPHLLGNVLDHISSLTIKAAYLTIGLTRAKRTLPDGRNAHLIIQPADWWLPQLAARWHVTRTDAGQKSLKAWLRAESPS